MLSHLPPNRLDLRAVLETPLRQFVPWLAAVLLVSWAGYPGVICVTPMAWLMALRVGLLCVTRSTSQDSSHRLLEAGLAGAFFGLLQGLLFIVIIPFAGPIAPGEEPNAVILTILMLIAGIFAGAILSLFTAFLTEQRKKRTTV